MKQNQSTKYRNEKGYFLNNGDLLPVNYYPYGPYPEIECLKEEIKNIRDKDKIKQEKVKSKTLFFSPFKKHKNKL